MKFKPQDIAHARATRDTFAHDPGSFAAMFYRNLFDIDPGVRQMFPEDMQDQGRKLMATIVIALDALENWDRLAPTLAALARRHLGYGVEARHYAVVVQAFLATLEESGLDTPTRNAWQHALGGLTGYMIEVAYPGPRRHHLDVA